MMYLTTFGICFEVNELDPALFLSASWLAWQTALKKDKSKVTLNWYKPYLNLISNPDIDMLVMVEKVLRNGICYVVNQSTKINNKYMKGYDKKKESSYLKHWVVNNLYGWAISQKLPVGGFEWVENKSQSNKDFIKNYNEDTDEGYFSEVDVQCPKILHDLHNDLPFLP